jgi:hypothetical protein
MSHTPEFRLDRRRVKARRLAAPTVLLLLSSLFVGGHAQTSTGDSLPNPYGPPTESWGQLPDGRKWGGVIGLSFDSKGHLWAFERCGGTSCTNSTVAPIVELDPVTGKTLKTFGAGLFVIPHDILVDKEDHDNIWVVDQGSAPGKGEQVWKFSPDGKVLMTLGKAGVKGEAPDTFNDPCSVEIGKHGDIFVADGHSGRGQTVARIMKFSKDGKFIKTWGTMGSAPGQLNDPHAMTMDSKGRLFVADRGNFRITIFDQDGNLIDTWKQFGIPTGLFIEKRTDTLYVSENFLRPQLPEFKRGIRIGSAKTGQVTAFIEDPDQEPKDGIIGPDSITVYKNTLYEGENTRQMMKKYVLK